MVRTGMVEFDTLTPGPKDLSARKALRSFLNPFRRTVEQGAGCGPVLARRACTSPVVTQVPKLFSAVCEGMSQSTNVAPTSLRLMSATAWSSTALRFGDRPKLACQ